MATDELVWAIISDVTNYCCHEDIPANRADDGPSEACAICDRIINALLATLSTYEFGSAQKANRIAEAHKAAAAMWCKQATIWKDRHDKLIEEGWVR